MDQAQNRSEFLVQLPGSVIKEKVQYLPGEGPGYGKIFVEKEIPNQAGIPEVQEWPITRDSLMAEEQAYWQASAEGRAARDVLEFGHSEPGVSASAPSAPSTPPLPPSASSPPWVSAEASADASGGAAREPSEPSEPVGPVVYITVGELSNINVLIEMDGLLVKLLYRMLQQHVHEDSTELGIVKELYDEHLKCRGRYLGEPPDFSRAGQSD